MFTGSIADKALGIGAILTLGLLTYGPACFLLGILDKATFQRLMRRQT
jgi:putative peptidoglycan lipid II flippase